MGRNTIHFGRQLDRLIGQGPTLEVAPAWMINYRQGVDPHFLAEILFAYSRYEGPADEVLRTAVVYWDKDHPIGTPYLNINLGTINFPHKLGELTGSEVVESVTKLLEGGMEVTLVVIDGNLLSHETHRGEVGQIREMLGPMGITVVVFEPYNEDAEAYCENAPLTWEAEISNNGYCKYDRVLEFDFDAVLVAHTGRANYPTARFTLGKMRSAETGNLRLTATVIWKAGIFK